MNAEHPSIYNRPESKIVENFTTISPNIRRSVFPLTFIVETVYLSDLSRLVVPSDERDAVGVSHFISQKK